MKKYVTFLIIILFSIFIGTNKVNAIKVNTAFEGGAYSTGITWNGYGANNLETGAYTDHKKVVIVNGQKYPAYCLDPGLHLNAGTEYNCTPSSDAGLYQLVKLGEGGEYTLVQLSIRFYAQMKGYGNSRAQAMKAAVARYWQIKSGFWQLVSEGCRQEGTVCSSDPNAYLSGNTGLLEAAYNMALDAKAAARGQSSGSGELTFTKTAASTKDQITYNISSIQEIKKVKFVCEGCTIVGADDNFSGRSGTLVVQPAPDCEPFTIKAYYVPNGVQICSNANSSLVSEYQYLVANFDASIYAADGGDIDTSGEPNMIHEDRGIECDPECCTEVEIRPNYIVGEINNCCLDNTHSWAKEYDLNQLVCYSDEMEVDHYWKMCNSETYLDYKMNGDLNEYCDIYCTERITVDIPGAITATSGRYFDLTTTAQGSKSPWVEGFKRCRTLIHFKKWQDDYRKEVEEQVLQYRLYQENRLFELLYQDGLDHTRGCTLHIRVECTGERKNDSKTCLNANGSPGNHCSATADTTSATAIPAFDQTQSYTEYDFVTGSEHNGKPYHWPKLDEDGFKDDADGYYKYYKLIYDASDRAEHRQFSYYTVKEMILEAKRIKEEKEAITASDSDDCCHAQAGVTCTWQFDDSCGNSEGPLVDNDEDVESVHAQFQAAANAAKAAYNTAANNAKILEEKLDKCDKYFTEYEGTDAQANFPFNAMFFGFEYTQVYLNDYGDLKKEVTPVPFDSAPGCEISGPLFTYGDEDMMVEPQYSAKYVDGDHITQAEDFAVADLEWQEERLAFEQYRDEEYEADQKFVQDAKYQAICSWNEPENTKYTLVQKGNVMETDFNVTKNDRQYYVHLSTLDGSYDTRWQLSGLGTNSKFDAFFAENGAVCSGRQSATTDGLFHCSLHIEHEIISTGKCNGERTTTETDECEPYNGAETALNFKIVDPAQVFTCNSFDECGYGYNWFITDNSNTLNEIKRKGANSETYSPSNLTFQVTLNTNDMKQIKNYNEYRENNSYGGYSDFSLVCDCPDAAEECNEVAGTQTCKRSESCRKCRSVFLNNLYNGYVNYGSGNHSVTGGSGSIESVRNNGHIHWAG